MVQPSHVRTPLEAWLWVRCYSIIAATRCCCWWMPLHYTLGVCVGDIWFWKQSDMSFTYDYMYWRLFCKSYLLTWFESSRAISYSKIIRGKHDKTKSLARCSEPAVHMLTLANCARCGEWEDLSDQLKGPMGWFQIGYRILQAYIFFHVLICSSQCCTKKTHAKGDTDWKKDSLFQKKPQAFERQRSFWYRSSESGCPKIDSDSPHIHHLKRHRIHTECRGHWITHFGDQTIQMYGNFDKFPL